jgi:ATP-binding protein involved in chromosome partitioning
MTEEERKVLSQRLRKEQQPEPSRASSIAEDKDIKFISIVSGKGGVGKSTVTVNLAMGLARQGMKVGIIDADIYGFSIPSMMGIEQRPVVIDETILPVEKYGVKVMSMGFFIQDNAPVIWRGPMLGKMLRNFLTEVYWGQLDYLLLDMPPGTGDVALDVYKFIPQCEQIIVTTPHSTAAFVAARAGTMALQTTKQPIIGVIENMAWYEKPDGDREYVFGENGGGVLAKELKVDLLAQIPLGLPDKAEDAFNAVYDEDSPIARIYDHLAETLTNKTLVEV